MRLHDIPKQHHVPRETFHVPREKAHVSRETSAQAITHVHRRPDSDMGQRVGKPPHRPMPPPCRLRQSLMSIAVPPSCTTFRIPPQPPKGGHANKTQAGANRAAQGTRTKGNVLLTRTEAWFAPDMETTPNNWPMAQPLKATLRLHGGHSPHPPTADATQNTYTPASPAASLGGYAH